jgi:hypothetical protein
MNWYKKAKVNLDFISSDSYGDFKVLVNGKPYTFGPVDKDFAETLAWQIRKQPWKHGGILNLLKQKYNLNKMHDDTEEEKERMLSDIPSQKELWGEDELVR